MRARCRSAGVLDVAVFGCQPQHASPARNTTVIESAHAHVQSHCRERARTRFPPASRLALSSCQRGRNNPHCRESPTAEPPQTTFSSSRFAAHAKTEASAYALDRHRNSAQRRTHLRVTKNGEDRYVPMTEEMRSLLERMRADRTEPTPTSRVLLVKEAQGFITSACRALGIQRFTARALRHLFSSPALEASVDVRSLLAGWPGYKDAARCC